MAKFVWEVNAQGAWQTLNDDCQDFVESCYQAYMRGQGEERQRVRTSTPQGAPLYISIDFHTMQSKKVGSSTELYPVRRVQGVSSSQQPHASTSSNPQVRWATFEIGGQAAEPGVQAALEQEWKRLPRLDTFRLPDGRVVEGFQALEFYKARCDGKPLEVVVMVPPTGVVRIPDELEQDSGSLDDCGIQLNGSQWLAECASCGASPQDRECKICFCEVEPDETVFTLNCGHTFHRGCIERWFETKRQCPTCTKSFGKIFGAQPRLGTMRWCPEDGRLQGHPRSTHTIVLEFKFPAGTSDDGQPYMERAPRCYLPNDAVGHVLLELYKVAFKRRVMFGFGARLRDGNYGATFNIHIKTSRHRGQQEHGYPDDTYFSRSLEELHTNGVTIADLPMSQLVTPVQRTRGSAASSFSAPPSGSAGFSQQPRSMANRSGQQACSLS